MTATFDNRRFRTTQNLLIDVGALATPNPDGKTVNVALHPDGPAVTLTLDIERAERFGVIRQLADGEA